VTHAKPVCFFTPANTVEMASASSAQCVSRPRTIVIYVQGDKGMKWVIVGEVEERSIVEGKFNR